MNKRDLAFSGFQMFQALGPLAQLKEVHATNSPPSQAAAGQWGADAREVMEMTQVPKLVGSGSTGERDWCLARESRSKC
jgi:hypothetical protein